MVILLKPRGHSVDFPTKTAENRKFRPPGLPDLSLWTIFGGFSVDNSQNLSTGNCGFPGKTFPFHRRCGKSSHRKRGFPQAPKGKIGCCPNNFVIFDKLFPQSVCKTFAFPHRFPQPVEKADQTGQFPRKSCGTAMETKELIHTDAGTTNAFVTPRLSYTPLISFTISSISARKAGFCAMRFSMVSIEEITVEWSRLRIFPMLGRDISVTWRMT